MNVDLFIKACSQRGTKEVTNGSNPEINKFFKRFNSTKQNFTEETAWCSAFLHWCCDELNIEVSGSLAARSWLKVGTPTDFPMVGDIVVMWRESPHSWKGHVGIFVGQDAQFVSVLGGNQSDSVSIQRYKKDTVLGYRILRTIPKATNK